jgi:hypothetical protein
MYPMHFRKEWHMRLDARAFGTAAGIIAAMLFTICAFAVAVAPGPTTALGGYLTHMDHSEMARSVTFGRFIGGLVIWSLGTAVIFAALAWVYNWLVARAGALERVAAGRPMTHGAQL